MKKQVLLLMTGLLFACSGAFAQQEWEELVVNGDFEGSDFSSFSIQDYRDGSSQDLTADDIVVDDNDANNHCAKITLTITPRYCYFIINLAEPLSEGDMLKFSMRAKTSSGKDVPIRTDNMGDIVVKTGGEWSTFTYEGVVSSELAGSQAITLKFGLVPRKNDIFYFDDISMKVNEGNPAPINFADAKVKEICVSNWDINGDGELSYNEAEMVTDLGEAFRFKFDITSFDEFQYFTSVKNIPEEWLWHSGIKSVVLPNSIISIGGNAFSDCSSLTSISLPNSVQYIGRGAFYGCSNLTTVECNGEPTIVNNDTEAILCSDAFLWCNALTSVAIPASIRVLQGGAFNGCDQLTEVTIPKTIVSINGNPFIGCSNLQNVNVEAGNNTYLSDGGVLYTIDKKQIICYPAGKTASSYTIANEVEIVGESAFSGCVGLTDITIPSSVKIINNDAFRGCNGLTSVILPEQLEYIGEGAFSGCSLVTDFTIPNNVTFIGRSAFYGTGITMLTIPQSVVEMSGNPADGCKKHETVNVEEGNPAFVSENGVLFNIDKTHIICYPAGKADNAYILPNTVKEISGGAFNNNTHLSSVTLGENLEIIGSGEFIWCSGLKDIYCNVRVDDNDPDKYIKLEFGYNTNVFLLTTDWMNPIIPTLHVPSGCKQYYEQCNLWNWMNIVEMGLDPVDQGETIDFGNEIDENTDLNGTVVDNVLVNISNENGGYDPVEGCIVVNTPTDDSSINGQDIFGDDFKENYTGIVFKVAPGSGSIKVEAQTTGNMVLKVKIGEGMPITMELEGKLKVTFPYSVTEETNVYIYGGMNTAGAKPFGIKGANSSDSSLKIYSIEVDSNSTGIDGVDAENDSSADAPVYNLNGQRVNNVGKGIYIKNGRKVLVK